jgi:hypothetical protein
MSLTGGTVAIITHVVNISATIADYASSSSPSVLAALTKGGLASPTG